MSEPFSVPVTVRGYETDTQGHLNQSVYLNYAEHARWSMLQAAGIRQADLVARQVGPVALETTIRFRRELLAGDEVAAFVALAEVAAALLFGWLLLDQLPGPLQALGGVLVLAGVVVVKLGEPRSR
ncbi:acyl-CoA thioesterase, partial [Streptomyces scabiei]|uniref:acyl-CoA thioesterase n=1 Tax=Streptomyces scabiei TaxID=1930 RepID=UPI0039EE3C0F